MSKPAGPIAHSDAILHEALSARGISEAQMPPILRDRVISRSRKGKMGAIVLKSVSGLQKNAALKVIRQFERNIGGKDDLREKLSALDDLSKPHQALLRVLEADTTRKSLARLMAETPGVEPISVLHAYARGCIELGKVEAAIQAHKNLPAVAEELVKMALSKVGRCGSCGGSGKIHARSTDSKDKLICLECRGDGTTRESANKTFAIDKLLDMTGQKQKGPQVVVNTQVGVKVGGIGENIFSKVMRATDEVLYKRPRDIVEAEVVSPEGD